ncbi:MAG: 2-amino-4-hydroxy-6-hydroxymethyldihydropteridine diphosphokinase [Chloroherpetonaceae bacterium]|nr:2-amino-4-hydroxy-6-hydroxymethyldihydropteridine diphosphokinase [Chloroherpetonaceae bacterium]MDW8436742.1 2-amino-4-hydroxy-6-hydroxymethyldihydropteridine diphosphokinase [Chloroherpetonaceae bacterium]
MSIAFVGLGSNLGERLELLNEALRRIGRLRATHVLAASSVYESPPIDCSKQNDFLNAVAKLFTELSPIELLNALKRIERELGRPERYARWSPRPIDLDLLFYDDLALQQEGLTIPHPEIPNRKFVLAPMLEIEDLAHPVLNKRISELLAETPDVSIVRKIDSLSTFNEKPR